MGAAHRIRVAGLYHLMTRSIDEERIFRTGDDYAALIGLLVALTGKGRLVVHAFCILRTHYHLLATFEQDDVMDRVMHSVNRRYAVGFNRRHCRRGKLFDGPYTSVPVVEEAHLQWLARYIADNPHRRPWPYSSCDAHFDFVDPTPLIDAFGSEQRWREFIAAAG